MSNSPSTPDAPANGHAAMSLLRNLSLNDAGSVDCPDWIAEKLGVPAKGAAVLEVTCSSFSVYEALCGYLEVTAVDAVLPPPKIINADCNNPESPGRLSTLWTGQGDSGCCNIINVSEPQKPEYRLGMGYARAQAGGEDVFIAHLARGDPFQVRYASHLFRSLQLFAKEPATLKKIADDAMKWKHKADKRKRQAKAGSYVLYTLVVEKNGSVYWRNHGLKDARPLDSVFLKPGLRDLIVNDFKNFSKPTTKEWYLKHGIPYRRSYLFYGPPGVGKTSLIRGLAGELELTTCFLNLADKDMGNQQLQDALSRIPKPSMIVLEDVDVLFNEDRKKQSEASLTFSGLLNALDGLISADGILTVMTTNHIDRLDPALIRAGRVDRRFEFLPPDRGQVSKLFKSYYPDCETWMPKTFADTIFNREEEEARSIATLQQHFVYTRENSAQECLDMVPQFFREFYPSNFNDPTKNLYV